MQDSAVSTGQTTRPGAGPSCDRNQGVDAPSPAISRRMDMIDLRPSRTGLRESYPTIIIDNIVFAKKLHSIFPQIGARRRINRVVIRWRNPQIRRDLHFTTRDSYSLNDASMHSSPGVSHPLPILHSPADYRHVDRDGHVRLSGIHISSLEIHRGCWHNEPASTGSDGLDCNGTILQRRRRGWPHPR
jgi:hypothetical protein